MPSVAEFAALRRCLPQFRDVPPADVRAMIGEAGAVPLEAMPSEDARRLIELAARHGLGATADNASSVCHLPFDRTTGCAWLIEDECEGQAVASAMLAAGVPVQDVEV